ncbi:hypothetical protein ACTID9_01190 [Brevibacillus fluminis]|uniref:hypothetical protein n=1 Tax=Brevibacillus fluminis TaxID=511487 RepID=UPI003F8CB116
MRLYHIIRKLEKNPSTHKCIWRLYASENFKSAIKIRAKTEREALTIFREIEKLNFLQVAQSYVPNGNHDILADAFFFICMSGFESNNIVKKIIEGKEISRNDIRHNVFKYIAMNDSVFKLGSDERIIRNKVDELLGEEP